jgi:hypothetical protein
MRRDHRTETLPPFRLTETSDISAKAAMAMLEHVQLLQVQYGAIILSFLGAVHWGFEWAKYGGVVGNPRYILGVAPVLAGWSTLLLAGPMALVGQWAAFFGMWYADQRATTNGWTPRWYSTVRPFSFLAFRLFLHLLLPTTDTYIALLSTASGLPRSLAVLSWCLSPLKAITRSTRPSPLRTANSRR